MRRVALRQLETKDYPYVITGSALLHNSTTTFNLNYYIGQGTGDANRIGDEIFLKGFKVGLQINPSTGYSAISYRVLLIRSKQAVYNTSISYSNIFKQSSSSNLVNPVDTEKVTVLKSRTVKYVSPVLVNATPTYATRPVTVNMWCNMRNQKFKYDGDNSGFGKFYNYYLVVMPYAVGGSDGVTNLGTALGHTTVYYKDG